MSNQIVKHEQGTATKAPRQGWLYAPSPETADHFRLKPRYELFIGGKWVAPSSGRYFPTINPATETVIAEVAEGDEADPADVRSGREAQRAVIELEEFVGHGRREALDAGNAVTGFRNDADLVSRCSARAVVGHELLQCVADLVRTDREFRHVGAYLLLESWCLVD